MAEPSPPDTAHVDLDSHETVANAARMYDYFLGGHNNLPVDRERAEKIKEFLPETSSLVWENRRFLQRAVRELAGAGLRQFVDIGPGLPTQGSVHEIAKNAGPGTRVAYIDNDPTVLRVAGALLTDVPAVTVMRGDVRQPESIISDLRRGGLIDLSRPVVVLLVAVLHFVHDKDRPGRILRTIRDALAPGSYLVLSHLTDDGPDPDAVARTVAVYEKASAQIVFRNADSIRSLFAGWQLVDPGFVQPAQWHPDENTDPPTGWLRAGVGRLG